MRVSEYLLEVGLPVYFRGEQTDVDAVQRALDGFGEGFCGERFAETGLAVEEEDETSAFLSDYV